MHALGTSEFFWSIFRNIKAKLLMVARQLNQTLEPRLPKWVLARAESSTPPVVAAQGWLQLCGPDLNGLNMQDLLTHPAKQART